MSLSLKSSVKAVLRSWTSYAYNHYADIRDATRILKSVESYKGTTKSRDLKLCDDYAGEVLRHKRFAPAVCLYGCVLWVQRRLDTGNYYGLVVVPKLQGRYGRVSESRALNAVMLRSDAFPD